MDEIDVVDYNAAWTASNAVWAALAANDDEALGRLVAAGPVDAAALRAEFHVSQEQAAAMRPINRSVVLADGCLAFMVGLGEGPNVQRWLRSDEPTWFLVMEKYHPAGWRLSAHGHDLDEGTVLDYSRVLRN